VVSFVEVIKQAVHEFSLTSGLLAITSRGFNDPTKLLLDCDKRGDIQLFRLPALKRVLNAQKPITQHKVSLHDFLACSLVTASRKIFAVFVHADIDFEWRYASRWK